MKKLLKNIAVNISDDQAGVLFCLIGISIQGFHTFYIIMDGSSLPESLKLAQSILAAIFFSFGLLYFLFKQGRAKHLKNVADEIRYKKYISNFTWFEVLVNEHYWARSKIIIPYKERVDLSLTWYQTAEWYDWSILAVFAFAVPLIMQSYANSIVIKKDNEVTKEDLNELDKIKEEVKDLSNNLNQITQEAFNVRVLKQYSHEGERRVRMKLLEHK